MIIFYFTFFHQLGINQLRRKTLFETQSILSIHYLLDYTIFSLSTIILMIHIFLGKIN